MREKKKKIKKQKKKNLPIRKVALVIESITDHRSKHRSTGENSSFLSSLPITRGFKFESCFQSIDSDLHAQSTLIVYVSRAKYKRIPIKIYSTSRIYGIFASVVFQRAALSARRSKGTPSA